MKERDVRLKQFRRLVPLLKRLREVGCGRDRAGNRQLHFDQYCLVIFLYLFNPLIDSLRMLQEALEFKKVAKALGVERFSLGSFSESVRVFDPAMLKQVVQELAGELRPLSANPQLGELKDALTLVDSSVLAGLSRLAQAAAEQTRYCTSRDGRALHGWRLHLQLDLATFCPTHLELTGARNAGAIREHNVLRHNLLAGRCYVGDCGYADRALLAEILAAGSSFVMRVREDSSFEVIEEKLLSQEALDAGVVRDARVRLGGAGGLVVRLIELQVQPHPRRTRKAPAGIVKGTRITERLLIVTSLMDLAAELVALIYRHRYSVELFFRFLKQLLGLRHLLSQRQEGVQIQVYCAVIACMLISLQTGRKPDKLTARLLGWYLLGVASEQEVVQRLNRPDRRGTKLRAKEELWKKLGY